LGRSDILPVIDFSRDMHIYLGDVTRFFVSANVNTEIRKTIEIKFTIYRRICL